MENIYDFARKKETKSDNYMKTSKDKRLYMQAGHGTTLANTISNCNLTGSLTATNVGIFYGWGDNVPEA